MDAEAAALAALDPGALARDAAAMVRIPSVTGDERGALEALAELAAAHGLEPDLHQHDLPALRAHPDHPGEEAPREELWGLTATLAGGAPGRICVNGHVDVVGPGTAAWRHGPWSGALEDGRLHGRGAVDMKGAVVAALHALGAVRAAAAPAAPSVVLQCVSSEEDGGLGTFAALERDAAFDAAVIPEPTGFDVVCAQAGALTFRCVIPGRSAHAAVRLEGCSAIDRFVEVHRALAELEVRLNAGVEHPLMAELALPYPLLVGQVSGGTWSSQVPDRVELEGRVGVPGRHGRRRRARRARGRRPRGARRRRGRRRGALDGRRLPAGRDGGRPSLGRRGGRLSWPTSAAARRGSSARPTAPTCGCSRRAGSRA